MTSVKSTQQLVLVLLLLASVTGCASLPPQQTVLEPAGALEAAVLAIDGGAVDEAQALLVPLLALDGQHKINALHMLTRMYAITGDSLRMRDTAQALLIADGADALALEVLGLLALAEGHAVAAQEYLFRALQSDASRWAAWNGLGILADEQSEYVQAAAHFQRGLEIVPGHPVLMANLGWSKVLAGDAEAGAQLLRDSLETAPDSIVTHSNLAFAVALQGRYEDARKLYSELYDPSIAANNIGYAALLRRDIERAETYLREALTLKPSFYEKASNNLKIAYGQ
ncbi:MAG: hypothetical protein RLZZ227_647 [Pseudomonadota bacterium]|jgi:Flp pilus assembly protein TadD